MTTSFMRLVCACMILGVAACEPTDRPASDAAFDGETTATPTLADPDAGEGVIAAGQAGATAEEGCTLDATNEPPLPEPGATELDAATFPRHGASRAELDAYLDRLANQVLASVSDDTPLGREAAAIQAQNFRTATPTDTSLSYWESDEVGGSVDFKVSDGHWYAAGWQVPLPARHCAR